MKKPMELLNFYFFKSWCKACGLKASDPRSLDMYLIIKGVKLL